MKSRHQLSFYVFTVLVLTAGFSGCGDDKKAVNPNPSNPVLTVNLDFELNYLDLETGNIDTTMGPIPPPAAEMDFNIGYDGDPDPGTDTSVHAVVVHRQALGRMIAYLPNRTFASVTASDTAGAPFTSSFVAAPFDTSRVILLKTDSANVYKLGNPVETSDAAAGVTFDYQKL